MRYDSYLCGTCKNFLGGGDFGTCCTKTYELRYALTYMPDCKHYEFNADSDWVVDCPKCEEPATYYIAVGNKTIVTKDGFEYKIEKYWQCPKCEETIQMIVSDKNGELFRVV